MSTTLVYIVLLLDQQNRNYFPFFQTLYCRQCHWPGDRGARPSGVLHGGKHPLYGIWKSGTGYLVGKCRYGFPRFGEPARIVYIGGNVGCEHVDVRRTKHRSWNGHNSTNLRILCRWVQKKDGGGGGVAIQIYLKKDVSNCMIRGLCAETDVTIRTRINGIDGMSGTLWDSDFLKLCRQFLQWHALWGGGSFLWLLFGKTLSRIRRGQWPIDVEMSNYNRIVIPVFGLSKTVTAWVVFHLFTYVYHWPDLFQRKVQVLPSRCLQAQDFCWLW